MRGSLRVLPGHKKTCYQDLINTLAERAWALLNDGKTQFKPVDISNILNPLAQLGIDVERVLPGHKSTCYQDLINTLAERADQVCDKEVITKEMYRSLKRASAYFNHPALTEKLALFNAVFSNALSSEETISEEEQSLFNKIKKRYARSNLTTAQHTLEESFAHFIDITIIVPGKLKIAIEYDGPQHFTSDKSLTAKSSFRNCLLEKAGWIVVSCSYENSDKEILRRIESHIPDGIFKKSRKRKAAATPLISPSQVNKKLKKNCNYSACFD